MARRIAITGLGAISALGDDVAANWAAARDGRGAIRPHRFDPGERGPPPVIHPAAMVESAFYSRLEAWCGRSASAVLDRFALFTLSAALEALEAARLGGHPALARRAAVVLGHGQGGQSTLEQQYERFFGLQADRAHPASVPKVMLSGAASAVAMQFGVRGPVFATSSACASSAHAIAQGAALVASGQVDLAVVGGSEAIATPGSMCAWRALRALSETTCRPFAADRDGMVMGEGGAALVLEDWSHARARGAVILGEFLGAGMSSDAAHITRPSPSGMAEALADATAAGDLLQADEVLIAAHGTGTPLNDVAEAEALRHVFGARLARHAVIATKSAHGHLIGGSAALQSVLALMALREGMAPPVLNVSTPDPDCALDLVLGRARPITARRALVNAFAFGGLNVALAFAAA